MQVLADEPLPVERIASLLEGDHAQSGKSAMERSGASGVIQVFVGTFFATVLTFEGVGRVNEALFLWPVSAVALALALPFWHYGWKYRLTMKAAGGAGLLLGALISGMPLWLASILTGLQCLDIFFGRLVLGPNLRCFEDLKRQSNILRFVAMTVVVPALTGCLGAYPLAGFLHQPVGKTAVMSILANSLGFAIVVPAVLYLKSDNFGGVRGLFRARSLYGTLSATIFVLSSSLIFWQNKGPFLFMVFPPMVVVILAMGLEGAVFTSVALSVIGWIGTSHGHGPILLMKGSPLEHLLTLQGFVWGSIVTALPIGGLLDERRQAERNMADALHQKTAAFDENQRLVASLKASNDRFQAFMTNGPFAAYIKDADGAMVFYNKFMSQVCGVSEEKWIGLRDHEIWPAELADRHRRDDLEVLLNNRAGEFNEVSFASDGTSVFWKALKFPYYDGDSEQFMLAGISFDVTDAIWREAVLEDALRERTKFSKKLEASRHLLENFLQNTPNLTYVKDDQGKFVFYNREVERFFGINATEWIGRTLSDVLPKGEAARYLDQDRQVLTGGGSVESIDELEDCDGAVHYFKSIKFSYKDIDGRTMLAKVSQDITAELRHQEALAAANRQLQLLATTDSLTGLARRGVFELQAENEFALFKRNHLPLSILLLDIDNFKYRNDTFGHAAGDEALKVLACVLRACVRAGDLVARIGGEEFAFLLPQTTSAGAMSLAKRIQETLRAAEHGPLPLTVSIGIATSEEGTPAWRHVLARADEAMYEVKQTGKNRAITYDSLSL